MQDDAEPRKSWPAQSPKLLPARMPARLRLPTPARCFALLLALLITVGFAPSALASQATLVADTHVNAARPADNSGALSNLNVGAGYTSLLRFDLSLLPPGTTPTQVSRAVLRLYVNRVDAPGLLSLRPVTGAWSEFSVTFASMPLLGNAVQVFSVGQPGTFIALDITALVQGWIAAPSTNFGVALSAGAAAAVFDSKENDLTAHPAALDIQIVSQGLAGPAGSVGATGPAGLAGASGQAGPSGATGPVGPAGASGASSFIYQGAYDPALPYASGNVVLSGGSSYTSLLAGPNRGNTPSPTSSAWGLVAAGASAPGSASGPVNLSYRGPYDSSINYAINDIVILSGSSFISLLAGNHGNLPSTTPASTSASWGVLAQGSTGLAGPQGVPGLSGAPGQAGPAGVPGIPGASGSAGAPGTPGLVYQGTYSSATNYALGDVILWQGASYTSLLPGNHGNTPASSPTQWGVLTASGPQGPVGTAGPQGLVGTQGALGPTGYPGGPGAQGVQGIAGQAGAQGLTGNAGTQGTSGPTGPQGLPGPAGLAFQGPYAASTNYALADGVSFAGASYVSLAAGNHGNSPDASPTQWALLAASGSLGPQGAAGPTGPIGSTGTAGVQGPAGTSGMQGPAGPQGPAALIFRGPYASSTNYGVADAVSFAGSTFVSLLSGNHGNTPDSAPSAWSVLAQQGSSGAIGSTGSTGAPGPAGPSGSSGVAGPAGPPVSFLGGWLTSQTYAVADAVRYAGTSYIALSANTGRQPDLSPSVWAVLAQAGAPGPAGQVGATGMQGPSGFAGPSGPQGQSGPIGPAGPLGASGATGPAGAAGPAGPQGLTGPAGLAFRGAYNAGTNYALNDAVAFAGTSYISLLASNAGQTPNASPAAWGLLAASGSTGSTGSTGPVGAQGFPGPGGAAGPTGANGTPGISFRGVWASGLSYAANDSVTFQGSSYLALSTNSAVQPDTNPPVWAVFAAAGSAGPTGAIGATGLAATVQVGTVTTGTAGTAVSIVNRGSASAAIFDFTVPQGATGPAGGGGTGGAGVSGIPFAVMVHPVSFANSFYSVNNTNQSANESTSVLTWVPNGCAANRLAVFSQQGATITITLRVGTPGAMADSALFCQVANGQSCNATTAVTVPAGSFIDLGITHSNGSAASVWAALSCN